MAEVLVVGKKISEMDLVTDIVGDEKIPTGVVGDKAVTTGQLLTYLDNNGKVQWGHIEGDITNQDDLQNQFTQQIATLQNHIQDQGNPHNVTKEQVGLGLVDNTSDMDKPVSTAVQEALTNKTHNSLLGRDADGAHPASAIVDASGQSQQEINNLTLTPFHFGAIGDGSSHKLSERYATLAEAQAVYPHAVSLDDEIDWCAIQALNNHATAANNSAIKVDWSGKFYVNRTISYIVPASGTSEYRTISGDMTLSISDNFIGDDAIVLHGRGIQHTGIIRANLRKKVKFGVRLAARGRVGAANYISFGIKLGSVFIDNAIIRQIEVTGNAMFTQIEFSRGGNNGTSSAYAGTTDSTAIVSIANSDVGSISSTSTITVSKLPDVTLSDCKIYVRNSSFVSEIRSIDSETNTLTVKPHLPDSAIGDTLSYSWGGLIGTTGSDSAGLHVLSASSIGGGSLIEHYAMYPCVFDYAASEYDAIAFIEGGLVGGINVTERYVEGNYCEYLRATGQGGVYGSSRFTHGKPWNFSSFQSIVYGRNADGGQNLLYGGMRGASFDEKGIYHNVQRGKLPRNTIPNGVSNGYAVDFNQPPQVMTYRITGNTTLGFSSIKEEFNDLFCYDSQEFIFVGTGLNSSPTGTITIAVLDGYTLNGGATNLTYSGFSAAAHFKFFLNVRAKDIQVSVSGVRTYDLSVSTQLPDGSNVNTLDVNTKLWFRGATTATNLPTPTTSTKVDGNISTVYSVATPGTLHNKMQVVEYVSLFEKWERVYTSSTGGYGVWKLVSYETKRGTTAQRPSNPQLGMRYYDTTLLATGKPIEWNGSNWIDMTGEAV